MQGETRKRWEELCRLAETEQDPEKFLQLHKEISRLLGAKEERLASQRGQVFAQRPGLSMTAEEQQELKELSRRLAEEKDPRRFAELALELNAFLERHIPAPGPVDS